jgi:hypothetical protein
MKIRALMIQAWFGKIPTYFKYHLATTKDLKNFDFLIITDDLQFKVEAKNYRVIYMTLQQFSERFTEATGVSINLTDPKKVSDFKICLADLFSKECLGYSHVGFYDIDTLFSEMRQTREAMVGDWDFITLADEVHADRINGPFTIMRNRPDLRAAYRTPECFADLTSPAKVDCDEHTYSRLVCAKYKVKKIFDCRNLNSEVGGKLEYHCIWQNGHLFSKGRELEQHHFYHKNTTRFVEIGDDTLAIGYNKIIANDFVWITGFDKAYAKIAEGLIRSIYKYSNRPCLVYSINFDWAIPADLFVSGQFIVKRLDLENADLDSAERNTDVVNYKPLYMIDAIKTLPNSKFAFIDADCSITANADSVRDYLPGLENYPLLNCHTHDDIIVYSGDKTFNSLETLLRRMGFQRTVYPRRKANFMIFDKRSEWFFHEQIDLYEQHKHKEPWIFALQDEDSANALLSKYEFKKSLPVIDIEETWSLDLSKYSNYSFGMGSTSDRSSIPTHPNQVIAFHQVKKPEDFAGIDANYGKTVIPQEEMVVEYRDRKLTWQRNSYHPSDEIPQFVDFIVYAGNYKEIYSLRNQTFRGYWFFCINDITLSSGIHPVKIVDSHTGRVLHSDLIEIQNN